MVIDIVGRKQKALGPREIGGARLRVDICVVSTCKVAEMVCHGANVKQHQECGEYGYEPVEQHLCHHPEIDAAGENCAVKGKTRPC